MGQAPQPLELAGVGQKCIIQKFIEHPLRTITDEYSFQRVETLKKPLDPGMTKYSVMDERYNNVGDPLAGFI